MYQRLDRTWTCGLCGKTQMGFETENGGGRPTSSPFRGSARAPRTVAPVGQSEDKSLALNAESWCLSVYISNAASW